MSGKWNLQDIRPPERNRKPARRAPVSRARNKRDEERVEEVPQETRRRSKKSGWSKKKIRIIAVILVVGIAGFALTSLFRGADVTVYPKFKDVTVQAAFTAHQNPEAGQLGYELLTLEENGEAVVTATGQEEVAERARGTITVYNEFSSGPQRLIKNTRFESSNGLVYRIPESIVVPGFTRDADDTITPGSITTEVFSDGTGEAYNIAPTRFTIPGLEGGDQFDLMYAQSAETFTGGFEGMRFILDEAELAKVQGELHEDLRTKLLERLGEERPAGTVFFEDAITFTTESLPSTQEGDNTARISEKVRLTVPVFVDTAFAGYIAQNTIAGYEGEEVRIEDTGTLTFSYPGTTTTDISSRNSIDFGLSGNARVIWLYDQEQLQSDLVGVSKTALPSVLGKYPAIERAEAVVRPFWRRSFPDNPKHIEVTEVLEENEE